MTKDTMYTTKTGLFFFFMSWLDFDPTVGVMSIPETVHQIPVLFIFADELNNKMKPCSRIMQNLTNAMNRCPTNVWGDRD